MTRPRVFAPLRDPLLSAFTHDFPVAILCSVFEALPSPGGVAIGSPRSRSNAGAGKAGSPGPRYLHQCAPCSAPSPFHSPATVSTCPHGRRADHHTASIRSR